MAIVAVSVCRLLHAVLLSRHPVPAAMWDVGMQLWRGHPNTQLRHTRIWLSLQNMFVEHRLSGLLFRL
jgi:hypothetical protein